MPEDIHCRLVDDVRQEHRCVGWKFCPKHSIGRSLAEAVRTAPFQIVFLIDIITVLFLIKTDADTK